MTAGYFDTDDYIRYLLNNFDLQESSTKDSHVSRAGTDIICLHLERLAMSPSAHVLEIGCGLGRILSLISERSRCRISGIDISRRAVEIARERLRGRYDRLEFTSVEDMQFPPNTFTHILCWGVFDLTEQHLAIVSMLHALRIGGKILLTGKNDNFEGTDAEALVAEAKSAEKGVPNHYTDYAMLQALIDRNGGAIRFNEFFRRRGDFANMVAVTEQPANFYEYCVIIEKVRPTPFIVWPIASEHSKTWKTRHER